LRKEIQLWEIELEHSAATAAALAPILSGEELDRASRFKFSRDRNRFVICRSALRHILAETLGVDPVNLRFVTGPHGKPRLANGSVSFNLSHSGARALIALSHDGEIGVDIEEIRSMPDLHEVARRFFSTREAQRLCALQDPDAATRAFFECWTRKEAFIKAIGEGLTHPLDSFEVTFFPDETAVLRIGAKQTNRWALVNIDGIEGYAAALVFERLQEGQDRRVVHRMWLPRVAGAG